MASKLIDHNPMLKKPILTALPVCIEHDGASRAVVEDALGEAWSASFTQSPASVVDALVRTGYLTEQITVDGAPYAGTLEDAYMDDSVSLDADVDAVLTVTESGRALVDEYAPEATLAQLFSDRERYIPVFKSALRASSAAQGATREAIEGAIDAAVAERGITGGGGQKIYAQYFIDALETAGGIEWDGTWYATSAGCAAID